MPASQNVDLQCEASLPIDDEEGDYYVSGDQRAVCSEVGQFVYVPINFSINVRLAISWWANPESLGTANAFGETTSAHPVYLVAVPRY
jgi:hypothetical protein